MHEEYLEDANTFYMIADSSTDERKARRYYRAAVFYTAGALEAFINYLVDGFERANTLPEYELAFLNDKAFIFDAKKAKRTTKTEFHRLEEKLQVLLKRFKPDLDVKAQDAWDKMLDLKKLRDALTHPRQDEDTLPITEYRTRVRAGISGIIGLMDILSLSIYKRQLRATIRDYVPE